MIAQIMEGKDADERPLNTPGRKAFRDQDKIRWRHFFRGKISKEWGNIRKIDNGKKC